jgi:hypothetical protein
MPVQCLQHFQPEFRLGGKSWNCKETKGHEFDLIISWGERHILGLSVQDHFHLVKDWLDEYWHAWNVKGEGHQQQLEKKVNLARHYLILNLQSAIMKCDETIKLASPSQSPRATNYFKTIIRGLFLFFGSIEKS